MMTFRQRRLDPDRLGVLARSRSSPNAFADFYERMSPVLLRFFASQARGGQAAFDLVAETFSKAF